MQADKEDGSYDDHDFPDTDDLGMDIEELSSKVDRYSVTHRFSTTTYCRPSIVDRMYGENTSMYDIYGRRASTAK